MERLVIRMEPSNTRSEVIPQKLGFQYEGTTRRSISYPNDTSPAERRDAKVYSLLRDEFEAADWRSQAEAQTTAFDSRGIPISLYEE